MWRKDTWKISTTRPSKTNKPKQKTARLNFRELSFFFHWTDFWLLAFISFVVPTFSKPTHYSQISFDKTRSANTWHVGDESQFSIQLHIWKGFVRFSHLLSDGIGFGDWTTGDGVRFWFENINCGLPACLTWISRVDWEWFTSIYWLFRFGPIAQNMPNCYWRFCGFVIRVGRLIPVLIVLGIICFSYYVYCFQTIPGKLGFENVR